MVAEEEREGYICGYSENYIKVYIKDRVCLGEIIPVRVEKIEGDRVYVSHAA